MRWFNAATSTTFVKSRPAATGTAIKGISTPSTSRNWVSRPVRSMLSSPTVDFCIRMIRSKCMPSRIEATPNRPGTWMIPRPRISMCSRVMGTAEPWMAPVLSRVRMVVSSATRLWPRLISASAISLLPMPGSPSSSTPTPLISIMVPATRMRGLVMFCISTVPAFMKWPVTRCVRITGTPSCANTCRT